MGGRYVQEALLGEAEALGPLLASGALHIFVCGDAKAMSKDVFGALVQILESTGGLAEGEGSQRLMALKQQRQYVEDVWG